MKTISINLYSYPELSKEAKEKALNDWNNNDPIPFLSESLNELLKEELKKNGIEGEAELQYSFGYSQGDGAMFEGSFKWEGYDIDIRHSGHYNHSNSKNIDIYKIESYGDQAYADDETCKQFEAIYQDICKAIEKAGYAEIEYQQSEEVFAERCEANDYTFEASGKMRNA